MRNPKHRRSLRTASPLRSMPKPSFLSKQCAVLVYRKSLLHPGHIAPVARATNTDYIYIYVRVQGRKRPELWTLNCPRTTVGPSLPVFETAWHCRVHLPEPLFAAPSHPEHLQITYQRIQSFLRLGKRLTSSILPFNSNMIPSCVDSQRWQGDA